MASSTIVSGLVAAALLLGWRDLVDLILDRVGPSPTTSRREPTGASTVAWTDGSDA